MTRGKARTGRGKNREIIPIQNKVGACRPHSSQGIYPRAAAPLETTVSPTRGSRRSASHTQRAQTDERPPPSESSTHPTQPPGRSPGGTGNSNQHLNGPQTTTPPAKEGATQGQGCQSQLPGPKHSQEDSYCVPMQQLVKAQIDIHFDYQLGLQGTLPTKPLCNPNSQRFRI